MSVRIKRFGENMIFSDPVNVLGKIYVKKNLDLSYNCLLCRPISNYIINFVRLFVYNNDKNRHK